MKIIQEHALESYCWLSGQCRLFTCLKYIYS